MFEYTAKGKYSQMSIPRYETRNDVKMHAKEIYKWNNNIQERENKTNYLNIKELHFVSAFQKVTSVKKNWRERRKVWLSPKKYNCYISVMYWVQNKQNTKVQNFYLYLTFYRCSISGTMIYYQNEQKTKRKWIIDRPTHFEQIKQTKDWCNTNKSKSD